MATPILSVLDLCPIPSGYTASDAIANSLDLAQRAEDLGYNRYWFAEHHNTGMLACSAPELLIARVGAVTTRLRVGSGGIMLPNHSALKVAETFRVLEAMTPGRVDLGLGRAPGTDPVTAGVLRRGAPEGPDDFPRQLGELISYYNDEALLEPGARRVAAVPLGMPMPELWILGSSPYGAQLAAVNGFKFAFAHHIQPETAVDAMRLYRTRFQASEFGSAPRSMVAIHAVCAPSDEEAETLAASADLALVNFRRGRIGRGLPSVAEAQAYAYPPEEEMLRRSNRAHMNLGSPDTLRQKISALMADTLADEVMIHTLVHDHAARVRSYRLLANAFAGHTLA